MRKLVTLTVWPVAVACVSYATIKVLSLSGQGNTAKIVLSLRKRPLRKEDVIIGCSSLAGMYQVTRYCF